MKALPTVITIDGPAGSGKSEAAARLADLLELPHLNTGLLYRSLAWEVLERLVNPRDEAGCVEVAESVNLAFAPGGIILSRDGGETQFLSVDLLKGDPRIANAVSPVCAHPALRETLIDLQRRSAADGCVAEGRDMGWRILPHASPKIWLVADEAVRIERITRHKGLDVALATVARDREDAGHAMKPAEDAITIDSTHLDQEAVVRLIMSYVADREFV